MQYSVQNNISHNIIHTPCYVFENASAFVLCDHCDEYTFDI